MKTLLEELRRRSPLLFAFGCVCWIGALVCFVLIAVSNLQVGGINVFIKPAKFFFSVGIAVWTFEWILVHLEQPQRVRRYSIASIIFLGIELLLITAQAGRGVRSHFNNDTWADEIVFYIMGLSITIYTVWTAIIGYHFFQKKESSLSPAYMAGIRWGIVLFVIFSLEGGLMGALLRHSVGGEDGQPGILFLNWNRNYGDLRIAHFAGIHALQILPVTGWFLKRTKTVLFLLVGLYATLAICLLIRALMGLGLPF